MCTIAGCTSALPPATLAHGEELNGTDSYLVGANRQLANAKNSMLLSGKQPDPTRPDPTRTEPTRSNPAREV